MNEVINHIDPALQNILGEYASECAYEWKYFTFSQN